MKGVSNYVLTSIALVIIVIISGSGVIFSLMNFSEGVFNIRSWIIPIVLLGLAGLMAYSAFNNRAIGK